MKPVKAGIREFTPTLYFVSLHVDQYSRFVGSVGFNGEMKVTESPNAYSVRSGNVVAATTLVPCLSLHDFSHTRAASLEKKISNNSKFCIRKLGDPIQKMVIPWSVA